MQTTTRLQLEPLATGRKPAIYLAGAIHHVPPEFALSWRKIATDTLDGIYTILDPTADKDLFKPNINTGAYTPEEIVTTDLAMISSAEIILAEISRKDIPYHGTSMELAYGYQWGKKIYVWGGCQSYWVRYHATQRFKTLNDAIDFLL